MRYKIFQNGLLINQIVASETFIKQYCAANNYTYEEDIPPIIETPSTPEPRKETALEKVQRENVLLKAQIQAQSDRSDFLEDCIAEMAAQVYA